MATREEIIAELDRRGVLKDPSKAPIVSEMRRRGILPPESTQTALESPQSDEKPGLVKQAFNLLNKPSEMSQKGLEGIADLLPEGGDTGGVVTGVLKGTPRVAAETLSEVAPKFIDAASILTAGASKAAGPVLKAVGKGAAKAASRLSGAESEALEAVAKDPSLLFTKGKKAVAKLFEAAKQETPLAATAKSPKAFINRAESLAERKLLTPSEAHEARKELDSLFGSRGITGERARTLRDKFTKIINEDPQLAEAIKASARQKTVESVRELVPSSGIGRLLAGVTGGASLASPVAAAALPLFSPIVQGSLAAVAGPVVRGLSNPRLATTGGALIRSLLNRDSKKEKK